MVDQQPVPPAAPAAVPTPASVPPTPNAAVPAPAAAKVAAPAAPAPAITYPQPPPADGYKDTDLVYVDPDTRKAVGMVEFSRNDKPKSLPYAPSDEAIVKRGGKPGSEDAKRFRWRKFFPWGTYKSMRRIYRLDGKPKDAEPNRTLEEVLPKALKDAYWND